MDFLDEHPGKVKPERVAKRATEAKHRSEIFTVLFAADFSGRVCETLCAYIGSYGNLMSAYLLNLIAKAGRYLKLESLKPPRRLCLSADAPDGFQAGLVYQKSAKMDVCIHLRHVTALKLRNTRWLVSEHRFPEPFLGRPFLELLGLNTSDISAIDSDRSEGLVDAKKLSEIDEQAREVRISRVLRAFSTQI